ncbi:MAG: hypothetical protein JWM42_1729 [Burkholderia sp.]|nr:hypothetical protein [Burkholderia sp.]
MSDNDNQGDNHGNFGSRLLSGLKDLILESEPQAGTGSAEKKLVAETPASMPASSATPAPVSASNSPMAASLSQLVLSRATAYTALVEAMGPLAEIIPDEITRYRAAFAVIKKGRTLEQVIQAIDLQHMQIVEDEVTRFTAQAKQKEDAEIHSPTSEVNTLNARIEAANAQIAGIRQETEARIREMEEGTRRDRKRIDDINREVEEKRVAIASVQRQFDGAVSSVKESLLQEKAKILKYLS